MPIKENTATIPTTTFILIRHAETVWNAARRFQGHADSPLTPSGRFDAKALGKRLEGIDFDKLVSSDLGRTMETATLIAEHTGHAIETDTRLRERHYGVLEGLSIAEVQAGYPVAYERLMSGDPEYVIPRGESQRQLYDRNIAYLKESIEINEGTTIALVVHGGVLDSLFRFVAKLPLAQPRCFVTANTSLSIIAHGSLMHAARWVIQTWGDVGHLGKLQFP